MKNWLLIFICCLFVLPARSQSKQDSLLHLLKSAKEDEKKVLLLFQIGQEFENSDLDKAKSFYLQARALGTKINYPLTEVKFVSNYTFALNMQGKIDSSLYWNLKGIEAARKLNDEEQLAKAYFNTGTSYQYLSDYPSAVEVYQKGLKLFEKKGDRLFMAQAYDILQNLYASMKQYDKAKGYGKAAVATFRVLNNPKLLAYSLSNLGTVYGSMNQKDSALRYFKEAEQIAYKIKDEMLLSTAQLNLGDVYLWKKQLAESKKYNESALALAVKNEMPETETIALRGVSYCYKYIGDYDNALRFVERALVISQKYKFPKQTILNLNQLASLAYLANDVWMAEKYEIRAKELQDTLWNEQLLLNTINTEKKFELDKKNTQLALQHEKINQQHLINWLLGIGLLSLIAISILGYRNYSHRKRIQEQRIKELETEKQLLATQSLLQGQEDERGRLARDLHDGLGGMLSGVKLQLGAMKGNMILTEENGALFNNALQKLDQSISEMRRVAHNMMPETLINLGLQQAMQDYCNSIRASDILKIKTEFHGLEQRLSATTEVNIYRIVQELVNNSIKHSKAKEILVQVMLHERSLSITVEDDGIGFETEKLMYATSGLQNIRSRVNYLGGHMDIKSQAGKGTSVFVECIIEDNG